MSTFKKTNQNNAATETKMKKGKKKQPIYFLPGNVTLFSIAAMDAFTRTKGNEQEV